MADRFDFTDAEQREAAKALLQAQRPGTDWGDLSEAEQGNLEADVEAVLLKLGGQPLATSKEAR